jgi:hypothetical protein
VPVNRCLGWSRLLDSLAIRSISAASSRISSAVGAIVTIAVTRNVTMLMPRISGSRNEVGLAPAPMASIPPLGAW